jgi:hypothetical protein
MDKWVVVVHSFSIFGGNVYGPFVTQQAIDLFINSSECLGKPVTICRLINPLKEVQNGRNECTEDSDFGNP